MPDTPRTPGQVAYEVYSRGMQPHHAMSLWVFLPPYCQAAWEAAAAAVQDLVRRELLAGFAQAREERRDN